MDVPQGRAQNTQPTISAMASDEDGICKIKEEIAILSNKLEEITSNLGMKSQVEENTTAPNDDSLNESQTTGSLCNLVNHLLSQSTLHGIPIIATTSRRWIKAFWILLLFAGTGMAVWQTVQITTEYFRYPVVTVTEVYRGNVILPQVTVCNENGYIKSKLLQEPRIMDALENEEELGQIPLEYLAHLIGMLPEADRIGLSHNISNFFYWNDDKSSVLSSGLLPRMMAGNCYTFIQTMHQQKVPHIGLFINLNSDEYVKRSKRRKGIAFLREEGIFPYSYLEPYIDLEPGVEITVFLRMETIIRLNGDYGNCQDREQKFVEETGIKYTEEVCKAVCLSKKVLDNCGCISKVYNSFPSQYKISQLFENVPDCMERNYTCYNKNKVLTKSDSCECKPRCDMKRYVLSDIKKKKITNIYWHCLRWDECMMQENDTEKWVMNNAVKLDFGFAETEHKEFRQVPGYPLSKFLSDIGGTLGLYMGVSLLTLAEIPQLMIGTIIFLFKRKVLRKSYYL